MTRELDALPGRQPAEGLPLQAPKPLLEARHLRRSIGTPALAERLDASLQLEQRALEVERVTHPMGPPEESASVNESPDQRLTLTYHPPAS
jgi:hypothetical protein